MKKFLYKLIGSLKKSWLVIITTKIMLTRLPGLKKFFKHLGVFTRSQDDTVAGNIKRFKGLYNIINASYGHDEKFFHKKSVIEIGCGDSIVNGVAMVGLGASSYKGIDIDINCEIDEREYGLIVGKLRKADKTLFDQIILRKDPDLSYTDKGTEALFTIPNNSIDFIYSNSVLEHIRLRELENNICRQYEILKSGGIAVHRVDLKDHLGGGLNNLRFSQRLWESEFFASSGFYTNRVRIDTFMDIFENCGFKIKKTNLSKWATLPIREKNLDKSFRNRSDLKVSRFDVVLERS